MRKTAALVFIFLLQISALAAEIIKLKQFTVNDGLLSNYTHTVISMPDRRILVAADGSFCLYDGNTFTTLNTDKSKTIPVKSFIGTGYYFDKQDRLWFRNYHELTAIDVKTYKFLPVKELLKNSGIKDDLETFFIDEDGNAWMLTTSDELYLYDWKNKAVKILTLHSDLPEGNRPTICDLVEHQNLHYIFTTDGIMRCYDAKKQALIYTKQLEEATKGYRHKAGKWDEHSLLIRFFNGLALYDTKTKETKLVVEEPNVSDWTTTPDGSLWVATRSGIFHFDKTFQKKELLDDLRNDDGTKIENNWMNITTDWQGGLWMCSFKDGLYYHNDKHKPLAYQYANNASNSIGAQVIKAVSPKDDTSCYLLTEDGVYIFDYATNSMRTLHPKLAHVKCKTGMTDTEGKLWISSIYEGLLCYDPATGNITNYSDGKYEDVALNCNFCYQINKDKYLVCTHGNNFGILYNKEKKFYNISKKHPQLYQYRNLVCAVAIGEGFLVGSQNGYFYYDLKKDEIDTERFAALNNDNHSNKCNTLLIDGQGRIWAGTGNGLLCYDEKTKKIKRYAEAEGLLNTCIQDISEDGAGNMWIATGNSFAQIKKGTEYANYRVRNNFTMAKYGNFMERSHYVTPEGRVLLGSNKGLLELETYQPANNKEKLKTELMSIMVMTQLDDNTPATYLSVTERVKDNTITLEYDENHISIKVSALEYCNPLHVNYRYKLEGIDNDWMVNVNVNRALSMTYHALPPGKYTLRVQTSFYNSDATSEYNLVIRIKQPWWNTWQAWLAYILAGALLLWFVISNYLKRRETAKDAEKQTQLNEMKLRFFTNISHEFRTPLTLILTPLQTLLERDDIPKDAAGTLDVIKRSAQSLNTLVTQLLDFRTLTQHGERLMPSVVQTKSLFENIEQLYRPTAEERNIDFTVDTSSVGQTTFCLDVVKVQKIINNLLSNAFKFTPDGGKIQLSATTDNDNLIIKVSDNGVGISSKDIPHIFDRFYQAGTETQGNNNISGSGVGLNIVKGYTELHQGTVSVESEEGKGTFFTVSLPNQKIPYPIEEEKIEEEEIPDEERMDENDGNDDEEKKEEKVKLLIVEDNRDFRQFMYDQLKEQYHVFCAADGEEGLSTVRVAHPDIIISDVMMPKMDGYQLCKAVKEDINLSHIPIVLLTAKHSDESRAEGYQAGADSYITKPFNMQVLQACIQMLIDQRRQRQQEFDKETEVNPQKITITPIDEKFIKKAIKCMEEHISDSEYDVVAFSSDMAMERTTLYRKMTAVVGKTPLQFMHSIRMKRAAKLLATREYPVADVAVMVGYNSTKYFSQHFKKAYGCYPSKYNGQ